MRQKSNSQFLSHTSKGESLAEILEEVSEVSAVNDAPTAEPEASDGPEEPDSANPFSGFHF